MNNVKRIISNNNSICFIIQTTGDDDFWWWEIDKSIWELYWKNKNPKYITGKIYSKQLMNLSIQMNMFIVDGVVQVLNRMMRL